jgi:hypothetical protein
MLTAYCSIEDVPHFASLHCSSRCDAPEPDWPPRGFTEGDVGDE